MNLNSIFIEQLSGNDSVLNFGAQKSNSASLMFSDIIKVCTEDSLVGNAQQEIPVSNFTNELFAPSENVVNVSQKDFTEFVELFSSLISNSPNVSPVQTTHKVDEADITKIQFVISSEELISLINEFSAKGELINPELVLPDAGSDINKPITISFKNGTNKFSISINQIKVDESYNQKVIADEFRFVDKIIVDEGLIPSFSNIDQLSKEPAKDNISNNNDSAPEQIIQDSATETLKSSEFFKAEVIKIIVPQSELNDKFIYAPYNLFASQINSSFMQPVSLPKFSENHDGEIEAIRNLTVKEQETINEKNNQLNFDSEEISSNLFGARLPGLNKTAGININTKTMVVDGAESESSIIMSGFSSLETENTNLAGLLLKTDSSEILNTIEKASSENNIGKDHKAVIELKNPTGSIKENIQLDANKVISEYPSVDNKSTNSYSLSYLLADLTEEEKSVFKTVIKNGELNQMTYEKSSLTENTLLGEQNRSTHQSNNQIKIEENNMLTLNDSEKNFDASEPQADIKTNESPINNSINTKLDSLPEKGVVAKQELVETFSNRDSVKLEIIDNLEAGESDKIKMAQTVINNLEADFKPADKNVKQEHVLSVKEEGYSVLSKQKQYLKENENQSTTKNLKTDSALLEKVMSGSNSTVVIKSPTKITVKIDSQNTTFISNDKTEAEIKNSEVSSAPLKVEVSNNAAQNINVEINNKAVNPRVELNGSGLINDWNTDLDITLEKINSNTNVELAPSENKSSSPDTHKSLEQIKTESKQIFRTDIKELANLASGKETKLSAPNLIGDNELKDISKAFPAEIKSSEQAVVNDKQSANQLMSDINNKFTDSPVKNPAQILNEEISMQSRDLKPSLNIDKITSDVKNELTAEINSKADLPVQEHNDDVTAASLKQNIKMTEAEKPDVNQIKGETKNKAVEDLPKLSDTIQIEEEVIISKNKLNVQTEETEKPVMNQIKGETKNKAVEDLPKLSNTTQIEEEVIISKNKLNVQTEETEKPVMNQIKGETKNKAVEDLPKLSDTTQIEEEVIISKNKLNVQTEETEKPVMNQIKGETKNKAVEDLPKLSDTIQIEEEVIISKNKLNVQTEETEKPVMNQIKGETKNKVVEESPKVANTIPVEGGEQNTSTFKLNTKSDHVEKQVIDRPGSENKMETNESAVKQSALKTHNNDVNTKESSLVSDQQVEDKLSTSQSKLFNKTEKNVNIVSPQNENTVAETSKIEEPEKLYSSPEKKNELSTSDETVKTNRASNSKDENVATRNSFATAKIQMPTEKVNSVKAETIVAGITYVTRPAAKEENNANSEKSTDIKLETKPDSKVEKQVVQSTKAEQPEEKNSSSNRNSNESFKNNFLHSSSGTNSFDIEKVKPAMEHKTFYETFKTVKQGEILPEFSKVIQQGEKQTLTLQLTPENLGKVKMIVDLIKNQIVTRIEVESESVKQFIQSNIEQLKQNLQSNGIQMSNVNISLADYEQKSTKNTFTKKKPNSNELKDEAKEEEPINIARKHMGYNTYEYLA